MFTYHFDRTTKTITAKNFEGLLMAWKLFGRDGVTRRFAVKKPLTGEQFACMPGALRTRIQEAQ